jgi:hypothetical protein
MADDPLLVLFSGTDLIVDQHGPDPLVVRFGDQFNVDLPDEPLIVQFAAVGVPGRDGDAAPIEAVADIPMLAGQPVAIDRATGRMIKADASFKPAAFVVGLLAAPVDQGFIASAAPSRLTLADWSAIAGAAQLAPGQPYFLAAGGGLTVTPPASACVVMIGKAVSPTTMLIAPQPPIQL